VPSFDASTAGVLLVLVAVLLTLLVELYVSRANEERYRRQGARDASDPVYGVMRWAYPGAFILMAAEGAITGRSLDSYALSGALLFVAGKALKAWAIHTLGVRWTYRVLVVPDAPLVRSGPYALVRHPNYVGVIAELLGMALMMTARMTGPLATLFFAELLRRRIAAEERALGLRT
jgi:methyltransferase